MIYNPGLPNILQLSKKESPIYDGASPIPANSHNQLFTVSRSKSKDGWEPSILVTASNWVGEIPCSPRCASKPGIWSTLGCGDILSRCFIRCSMSCKRSISWRRKHAGRLPPAINVSRMFIVASKHESHMASENGWTVEIRARTKPAENVWSKSNGRKSSWQG